MYFRSDSQEEEINEWLNYKAEDPLNYKEFSYKKEEWDNIPIIITKFILFLSRNMEALSQKWKDKFTEETTESLRYDLEGQLNDITDKIEETKELMSTKESEMNRKFKKLSDEVGQFRDKFELYQNQQDQAAAEKMANYIPIPSPSVEMDSKFPGFENAPEDVKNDEKYKGIKEATDKNKNLEHSWMSNEEFLKPEFETPRMFTMNQIKDLFYLHLSRSELKRISSKHETLVTYHDDALFNLNREHK
jgi:hypothetical protein